MAAALLVLDRTPREWAPYVEKRARGHRHVIEQAGHLATWWLLRADRMSLAHPFTLPAALGASPLRSAPLPSGRVVSVASTAALLAATASAQPGDVILLAPGTYRYDDWYPVPLHQPGTAARPITLRATRLGEAVIESARTVTFNVAAPFWRFENLVLRGVCGNPGDCEHAFHIVAGATGITIRNNRLEDFNAAVKINGEQGQWPDHGLIEGNTFINTFPRDTENPITPIDLVGASHWVIRGNVIADFARAGLGGATYGAFAKGAGEGTVFERNLVICEWKQRNGPSSQVGLSLGGGGTGQAFRRDLGRTGFEQIGGVIRDNLIVACNDDGIYLNAAGHSVVEHNTLLDTAGIDARFIQTSARVTANLVDGAIRARDGAALAAEDNASPFLLDLFAGWHPQRGYFTDPAALDLSWRVPPARVSDGAGRADLCGHLQDGPRRIGAFDDYASCVAQ